jgi:hypothetical protein
MQPVQLVDRQPQRIGRQRVVLRRFYCVVRFTATTSSTGSARRRLLFGMVTTVEFDKRKPANQGLNHGEIKLSYLTENRWEATSFPKRKLLRIRRGSGKICRHDFGSGDSSNPISKFTAPSTAPPASRQSLRLGKEAPPGIGGPPWRSRCRDGDRVLSRRTKTRKAAAFPHHPSLRKSPFVRIRRTKDAFMPDDCHIARIGEDAGPPRPCRPDLVGEAASRAQSGARVSRCQRWPRRTVTSLR